MKSTKEFIEEANLVHNGKYSYEKTIYTGVNNKIIITCPIHGDFEQRPDIHLMGHGCLKCGHIKTGLACKKDKTISNINKYPNISIVENPIIADVLHIIGSIYIIINTINNKVYIGKTLLNYQIRWRLHRCDKGYVLHSAILKYGWDKFDKFVIEQTELLDNTDNNANYLNNILNNLEIKYISIYNSSNPKVGYNLTKGGDGNIPSNYRAKKERLSNQVFSKHVLLYDLEGNFIKEWNKMQDIKYIGKIGLDGVRDCCNGLKESHKGYIWKFKDQHKSINLSKTKHKVTKVLQYSLKGKFIQEWESTSIVAKITGYSSESIRTCCNGKSQYSHGYIWKYKENDNYEKQLSLEELQNRGFGFYCIEQLTMSGKLFAKYESMEELLEKNPKFKRCQITKCLNGKISSSYGFKWKKYFISEPLLNKEVCIDNITENDHKKLNRKVLQYDFSGNFINSYINATEACKAFTDSPRSGNVLNALLEKTTHAFGYIWIREKDFSEELLLLKIQKVKQRNSKNIRYRS